MKKTILFCDNMLSSLIIFRGEIIKRYISQGYEVVALVPYDESFNREIPQGLKVINKPLTRSSVNILGDLSFLKELRRIIALKPEHVFSYTIKPNIYCAWLCKFYGVSLTAMVPGIGYVGNNDSVVAKFGKWLYRTSLKRVKSIFVLNTQNRDLLLNDFALPLKKVKLLQGGEGVNLDAFKYTDLPESSDITFLMVGRVLADKGYREYVSAARRVKAQYPNVSCQLLGFIDEENPEGIERAEVDKDILEGTIDYLGYVNDVLPIIGKSHCVVLPSFYGEGLNRSLMEACALGRIIITTSISGCKETVDDGKNGFLVIPRDSTSLAEAMLKVINLSQEEKKQMSLAGRRKAEQEFGMENVYAMYDKELN